MTASDTSDTVGAGVPDGRPFRLGFLLHLDRDIAPARAYREAIELFVARRGTGLRLGLGDPTALPAGPGTRERPAGAAGRDRPAHVTGSVWAPAFSCSRWRTRCGWPRTRPRWTSCPAAGWNSASARGRSRPPGKRSARTWPTGTGCTPSRSTGCTRCWTGPRSTVPVRCCTRRGPGSGTGCGRPRPAIRSGPWPRWRPPPGPATGCSCPGRPLGGAVPPGTPSSPRPSGSPPTGRHSRRPGRARGAGRGCSPRVRSTRTPTRRRRYDW